MLILQTYYLKLIYYMRCNTTLCSLIIMTTAWPVAKVNNAPQSPFSLNKIRAITAQQTI